MSDSNPVDVSVPPTDQIGSDERALPELIAELRNDACVAEQDGRISWAVRQRVAAAELDRLGKHETELRRTVARVEALLPLWTHEFMRLGDDDPRCNAVGLCISELRMALRASPDETGPVANAAGANSLRPPCDHGRPRCLHCEAEFEQALHHAENSKLLKARDLIETEGRDAEKSLTDSAATEIRAYIDGLRVARLVMDNLLLEMGPTGSTDNPEWQLATFRGWLDSLDHDRSETGCLCHVCTLRRVLKGQPEPEPTEWAKHVEPDE